MKYPKQSEPFKSQFEMFAWLFGMLSSSYSMLAQYEADERRRETDRLADFVASATTNSEANP